MNCHRFEQQVADWLSQRLSPRQSQAMAYHREECAACAKLAWAESRFREQWRQGATLAPETELWPQVSHHLETARPPALSVPRWAFGAVAACAVIGLCYGTPYLTKTAPVVSRQASLPRAVPSLGASLAEASAVNPAVDDPVGANLENVWVCLKANAK